jgi:cell wall-associated NlpC family hydrolase
MNHLYQSVATLDVFETADCRRLSTQLWSGRYFRRLEGEEEGKGSFVQLLEDGYSGYLPNSAVENLELVLPIEQLPAAQPPLQRDEIEQRLPQVLQYAEEAARQPNTYLWGGVAGPNFDCSGLVQRSFAAAGIWLPRDSYQQAEFVERLADGPVTEETLQLLQAGDLIFFQFGQRVDHVAIYWGDGRFLHSSGADKGHGGMAWDELLPKEDDAIAKRYCQQICRIGRIECGLLHFVKSTL